MANSGKITVNRAIDDATHANDATIVSLRISKGVLQTMIDAAVGKAVKRL